MRNVAFFIRSLNKGGAETQSILISNLLAGDYNTKLIVFREDGDLVSTARDLLGRDLIILESKFLLSKLIELYRLLKNEKIDILFNYLPSNNIYGIIIGRLAGTKYLVGGIRGSRIKSNKLKMVIQKALFNSLADYVISNSHKAAETYSEYGVNKRKIIVIPNSISFTLKQIEKNNSKQITILSIGRFIAEKDYHTSLKAIRKVVNSNALASDIKYIIIGYGLLMDQIVEWVDQLGLNENVEIIENPHDVNLYYQKADIFLLTSVNEGMPNVVLEAMMHSLPVVSTNAGDVDKIVENGESGFVTEKGDVEGLSDSLSQLISSYQLRVKFGNNGFQIVNSNFSSTIIKTNYQKLIDSLNG